MLTRKLIRPRLGREHGAILDLLSPPMVGRRRMHLPARFSALTLQVRSPSRFLLLMGSTDFGATPALPRSLLVKLRSLPPARLALSGTSRPTTDSNLKR